MTVGPMIGISVIAYTTVMGLWMYTFWVSVTRMRATRVSFPFVSRLYLVLIAGALCAILACLNDIARLLRSTGAFQGVYVEPAAIVGTMTLPFIANAGALAAAMLIAIRGFAKLEQAERAQQSRRHELENLLRQRTEALDETAIRLEEDHRERERILLELRAEHAMLDAIMKTSVGAICVIDAGGQIVFANGSAQSVLGVSADGATSRRYNSPEWQPTDLDDKPLPDDQLPFRRVMAAREPVHEMRLKIVTCDGTRRVVEINGAPLFGDAGAVTGVVFLVTDITKRLADEEILRDSEKRFRLMVEGLPSGAVFVERDTIYMNRAAEEITGYSRAELSTVNQWFWALYGDASAAARAKYERTRDEGFREVCIGTIRRKDGSSRAIECSGYRSETSIVWLLRDVTEQARSDEVQRRLNSHLIQTRSLEDLAIMADGVAHDCNNILTGILGSAELARHELPETDSARSYIEEIALGAERAADLCTMMMAYTGDAEQKVEAVDINSAVQEMVRFAQGTSGVPPGIRIHYELDGTTMNVRADASQIRKVLLALLQNAIDAIGDDDGAIEVNTQSMRVRESLQADAYATGGLAPGEYVRIVVRDTGCGMDANTRERAFDPFFTTKKESRGLGLTYALGIIRATSGDIVLESSPGRGTAVSVYLPAAYQSSLGSETDAHDEGLWRGTGTVLVVDDEQNVRSVTGRMLRKLGFEVILADNGDRAVQEIERCNDLSAVILDLTMPNMDGVPTLNRIAETRPDLPVLIATGYDVRKVSGRFPSGVSGFLQKPFTLHVLSSTLRDALAGEAPTVAR